MQIYFMRFLKKWLKFLFIISSFFILIYFYSEHEKQKKLTWVELAGEVPTSLILNSYCSCRPNQRLEKHDTFENVYKKDDYYIIFERNGNENDQKRIKEKYGLGKEKVYLNPHFTCDLDRVFSHGPNAKVIGYSYYGKTGVLHNI
jgi:hypothetical protein